MSIYNSIQGEKYNATLTIKEVARSIRKDLKKFKNKYKFSVRSSSFAGGSSITVEIKEIYIKNIYASDYNLLELYEKNRFEIVSKMDFEEISKLLRFDKQQLDNLVFNTKLFYSDEVKQDIKQIDSIVNAYNYDRSSSMTDYFDVNFYYLGCSIDIRKDI
jgi:hypothetical protein